MSDYLLSTMENPGKLKLLVLDGSPYNRGLIYGRTMRNQIHQLLVPWKAAFVEYIKIDPESFIKLFLTRTDYISAIKRWTPDLLEEIKGISEGAGVDFDTMLVYQFADEYITIGKAIAQNRCSSAGFSARDNQPSAIAQNMDIESYADGFQLVLHIKHENSDLESFVLTLPGSIGLNGINNKAIGICCNALTQLQSCREGLPVSCIVRGVLHQRTVDDAIAFIHQIKHASGQNYVIGGQTKIECLECSAGKICRFKPNGRDDVVWHTNHPVVNNDYRSEYLALLTKEFNIEQNEPNTRSRLKALESRLSNISEKLDIDLLKRALSSRDSEEFPVSREKDRYYAFTFASTIMVLSEVPKFHVAPGPPHITPYEYFTF